MTASVSMESLQSLVNDTEMTIVNDTEMHVEGDFMEKLHDLKYALELDMMASDAKWTLFVAAALSYRYDSTLKPIPQKFVSAESGCNIDTLVTIISDTPKLKVVLQKILGEDYDEFDTDVVDLLHSVLVEKNNAMLRSVGEEEFSTMVLPMLAKQEKRHQKPTNVFEVCPPMDSIAEETFRGAVELYHSKMAFYGDKLDSFYSIIHEGFPQAQKDETVNLYTQLVSVTERSPRGAGWGASACGALISCVAMCEYIDDPKTIQTNAYGTHVEVTKPDAVRAKYLLFYGTHFPLKGEKKAKNFMLRSLCWIGHRKYMLSLVCYAVMLAAIGITNNGRRLYLMSFLRKEARHILDFCKKIVGF